MSIKAVILAAGRGVRIRGISGERPKSLLEIGPVSTSDSTKTTFLERQIRCLQLAGIKDIAVVIGYNKEQILNKLDGKGITFIENTHPDLSESGSLHSFQFAMNSSFSPLDETSHTLLMDADIVYEQSVINDYVQQMRESSILISSYINKDAEEVRIYGDGDRPFFIGKGLKPMLVGERACLGEATGIVHFAPEDHPLVKEIANWLLGDPFAEPGTLRYKGFGPAKIDTEHEELSQRMMLLNKMKAHVFSEKSLFMEVDDMHEYDLLVKTIYPQILEADRKLKLGDNGN